MKADSTKPEKEKKVRKKKEKEEDKAKVTFCGNLTRVTYKKKTIVAQYLDNNLSSWEIIRDRKNLDNLPWKPADEEFKDKPKDLALYKLMDSVVLSSCLMNQPVNTYINDSGDIIHVLEGKPWAYNPSFHKISEYKGKIGDLIPIWIPNNHFSIRLIKKFYENQRNSSK